MNFNYSYKAFLISSLLVGNLILLMYSIKLAKKEELSEVSYDIEYSEEELIEEEEVASISSEKINFKTHKAFNESEKFISELENQRNELSEETQNKLTEMGDAMEDSKVIKNQINETPTKDIPIDRKDKSENLASNSNDRNSTNSYRLVDRRALYFPNPVYTCEGFGKVVLHIEVNNLGKVNSATFNKNMSTTTNVCLIESAIKYALKARFNTLASKPIQLGTITYIFPGQN